MSDMTRREFGGFMAGVTAWLAGLSGKAEASNYITGRLSVPTLQFAPALEGGGHGPWQNLGVLDGTLIERTIRGVSPVAQTSGVTFSGHGQTFYDNMQPFTQIQTRGKAKLFLGPSTGRAKIFWNIPDTTLLVSDSLDGEFDMRVDPLPDEKAPFGTMIVYEET